MDGIQVIARAAAILRSLSRDPGGQSLGQIAQVVGLPRSTVQRIVNALMAEGLVIMVSAASGYRLGPEIQSLARAGKIDTAEVLRPILARATRSTGETVDLAVMRNGALVFVDQATGTHRLRAVSAVGAVFPMATTANGKAALALSDDAEVSRVLARELGCDLAATTRIRAEIAAIRAGSFAVDADEHTAGISAIGCAFRDGAGSIYAVSIPVPSQRFGASLDLLTDAMTTMIADIRKLGFS